ncbi:MAG: class I SAM-dependent methyltransferase [Patescibacteria group bacterium]
MLIFEIAFGLIILGLIFWLASHLYSSIFYVPYVNSSSQAIRDALKLAKLKRGQTLLDLGCGRGDALVIAVRDFGAKAIGYEISPFPYFLAKIRSLKYPNISVYRRDIEIAGDDIKKADVIYLYLFNSVLARIENQIFSGLNTKTKIVSLAFMFKKHQPIKSAETQNLSIKTKVYLYKKTARLGQ